ncbi:MULTISPECIES: hypothetical protein [unclassified Luteococcus]|uniref:hypothetical protein n=1 Tax=unclassified Luteococcus TaxID=2639923 RepID=UPI00313BB82E
MSHDVVTETFHNSGGIKTGAIVRRIQPTSLSTLVCFTQSDGLYHVECRIELDDENPRHWRHYVWHDEQHFVERDHEPSDPADAVPSFAEYLLVRHLLQTGDAELPFTLLEEQGGSLHPAVLVHEGDEVGLYVDEQLTNRHRVVGDEVIASDWSGAGSRLVHDLDEFFDGLPEPVAVRVRNFLKG